MGSKINCFPAVKAACITTQNEGCSSPVDQGPDQKYPSQHRTYRAETAQIDTKDLLVNSCGPNRNSSFSVRPLFQKQKI